MMAIRYTGEFWSSTGVRWKVNILQDGYSGTATDLSFPADSPLVIEWSKSDKMAPVQCSNATLKLISETDRQFIGLYTVAVGTVRMDVYRNDAIYWSGGIDTELYEEPYSTANGYNVTLTFSDFACLDRFNWSHTGFMSVQNVITECLSLAGTNYSEIVQYISTSRYSAGEAINLSTIYVLQENFYDEEGEGMTARDVLEAILKPFALKLCQKGGKIYVYDLNAIHSLTASNVTWDGTDSALGVDAVYNNVRVSFSPYAEAAMMKGEVTRDDSLTSASGGRLFRMDYHRNEYGSADSLEGFRIHTNDSLSSNMVKSSRAKYFQICPIWSGEESTGIIMSMRAGDYSMASGSTAQVLNAPKNCGTIATGISTDSIIKCPRVYLGYASYHRSEYKLRINLSVLFDVRYNPFQTEGDNNEAGNWSNLKNWSNYGYVPIKLYIEDSAGNVLYHFENYQIVDSSSYEHNGTNEKWVSGAASWGQAYLGYYDPDDLKRSSGFGGWQTNKRLIGYYRGNLPESWETMDDGEYIPLPPVGGYIVLEIGEGIHQFDYGRTVKNIYQYIRWVAYKDPSITLCRSNFKEVETKDLEDRAWLNTAAREDIEIETIVGTLNQSYAAPNGKGLLFDSSYNIISEFCRAGVTARLERLLIGSVYSQYSTRHITLSGQVQLLPDFSVLSDAATAGKFLLLAENQDCINDTSDIVMAEFSADNYEGIEYE